MSDKDQFQSLLFRLKEENNLSQKELAKLLGISPSKNSEYLTGKRKVPTYIVAHVETLSLLSAKKLKGLIKKRVM